MHNQKWMVCIQALKGIDSQLMVFMIGDKRLAGCNLLQRKRSDCVIETLLLQDENCCTRILVYKLFVKST